MIGVQNIQSSGGTITSGDINYTIKNDGKYKSIEDLKNTVISYKAGSDYEVRTIRLRDIADVYEGYKDESTLAYLDGSPCVMIMLTKQSGKNSVQAAKNVRNQLSKIQAELPADVEILETSNTVDIISQTINEVVSSVIQGALLAIAVLFIFLRSLKSTLIVGLSIPLSVLITLVCMYLKGITINMISMAGLFLCLTNGHQPLAQRGDDGCAGDHLRRHGLGGSGAARPEPDPDRLRQRLPASGSVHRWICRSPYG